MMILRLCKRKNQSKWKLKSVKIRLKLKIRLKNKVNPKRNKSLLNNNRNFKESRKTKRRTENKLKLKKVAKLNKITTIKMEKEKIIIKKKWTTKINLTKAPYKGLSRNKTVSKENHQRISSTKVSTRKKQRWCKNDKV